jgi:hypothetical protein
LREGPAWIYSDYYSIDVVTSDPAANQPIPLPRIGRGRLLSYGRFWRNGFK